MLYVLTVFLSAFLLFQIQPMIARAILPWFGGAATLWTASVLFFQLGLLAAYTYAHVVLRVLPPVWQRVAHLCIVALSLLALPVGPWDALDPTDEHEPVLDVLWVLLRSVGVPYFVVAATAPLLQGWYAQASDTGARRGRLPSPYVLYAVSNVGSLLALLCYPFAVEPRLGLHLQFRAWSVLYLGFAVVLGGLAWPRRGLVRVSEQTQEAAGDARVAAMHVERFTSLQSPAFGLISALCLAAATNTLLLAVTATLAQNIAPVPLLWIVPLALYLLSFALPFGFQMKRLRVCLSFLAVLALVPTAYVVTATQMALSARLVLLMPAFFVMCLACHTELAYLRPHPRNLSSFYLMIALGGAVGGIFAAVVAPLVFNSYHELPISLAACVILAVVLYARSRGWSWRHPLVIAPLLAAAVMVAYIVRDSLDELSRTRFATRNFYGTLSIMDEPAPDGMGPLRVLVDDSIKHGGQLQAPMYRRQPTTYFGPESGIGLALKAAGRRGPFRVGVIGLGAGTLAAYGRAGDVYVFFEINPLVIGMASTEFSFLRDTPATVEVLSGDGRLLLERYVGPPFDVLVIDAFAGDAVPVHLVTREAFELYAKRLAPEGILAMQITNQYVDLKPIVRASASALALHAMLVTTDDQRPPFYNSTWVLLSRGAHRFEAPSFAGARPLIVQPVTWTDDHASLLSVVKP